MSVLMLKVASVSIGDEKILEFTVFPAPMPHDPRRRRRSSWEGGGVYKREKKFGKKFNLFIIFKIHINFDESHKAVISNQDKV